LFFFYLIIKIDWLVLLKKLIVTDKVLPNAAMRCGISFILP